MKQVIENMSGAVETGELRPNVLVHIEGRRLHPEGLARLLADLALGLGAVRARAIGGDWGDLYSAAFQVLG